MAENGAVLIAENGNVYSSPGIKGKQLNSTGAGDSMIAGFIAGYIRTDDFDYALKLGNACGSATAFSEGIATKDKIEEIIKNQM